MSEQLEAAIARVRLKASGRTRYAGSEPWDDETLLAEVERLRAELATARRDGAEWMRERAARACEQAVQELSLELAAGRGAVAARAGLVTAHHLRTAICALPTAPDDAGEVERG